MTLERFVSWTLRHGRLLWFVALLVAIPAGLRTVWLYQDLRSDLEELLPPSAPSVVALNELRQRVGGRLYLGVVVDTQTPARITEAERFLDALASRIRTYPPRLVANVRLGTSEERAFLDRNGALYIDLPDLTAVRDRVRARKDYEVAKETGSLLDEEVTPPPVDLSDVMAKYERRVPRTSSEEGGRYVNTEKHLALLLIELGNYSTGTAAGRELMGRVRNDIASIGLPSGMRVGFSGDTAISVEELTSLVQDLSIASVLVVFAVLGAIVLYYRWWRSIVVVFPPLVVATVYAFGLASLPPFGVTNLNSNTAFLGSIILGNGINFGLVLLSRYVEERREGLDVESSLVKAIRGTRGGTLTAAAAAGASYTSLAITEFRGFRQFGFIGGFGMLFAWVAAFVLTPSLIAWVDRGEATRPGRRAESTRVSYWVTRAVGRAPRLVSMIMLVVTIAAGVTAAGLRSSDIETDFAKLRRRDTWTSGEGYWGKRMNDVLGEYLSPFVFLTDRPEDAQALADRLRSELGGPRLGHRIDRVRTLDDVVPRDQEQKIALAGEIREELTPTVRAALTNEQRRWADRFLGPELPRPITIADLPATFTFGLRERDGSFGKVVLVYPSVDSALWDANEMRAFVGSLRAIAAESTPGRRPPRLAGAIALSSDITEAVRHDAPIATAVSFAGVVLVVFFLLGRRPTMLYVTASLLTGVIWLLGATLAFDAHINFANFIAFPIAFGIGVDYSVNLVSRWEQDPAHDILAAVRTTGSAVGLCSVTTILGYSSLLLAANRALFSFGLLAVLAEITSDVVALIGLPALLVMISRASREPDATEARTRGRLRTRRERRPTSPSRGRFRRRALERRRARQRTSSRA